MHSGCTMPSKTVNLPGREAHASTLVQYETHSSSATKAPDSVNMAAVVRALRRVYNYTCTIIYGRPIGNWFGMMSFISNEQQVMVY